jgi:deoxycytidylate deaminase
MLADTERLVRDPSTELVFGLVAPVGADLGTLEADLSKQLRLYGYQPNPIRLSALLQSIQGLEVELKDEPELDRVTSYMDAGNELRKQSGANEFLALWAIAQLHNSRPGNAPVQRRTAHILRSIKHPAEARALRAVYGSGFFLIGLSASTPQKIWHLEQQRCTTEQAEALIKRDAGEDNKFGQQTREAFELADVFIRQDPEHRKTTDQLERFLRLVFGAPHETPRPDEHAMFLSYASSLRSGDLSRQVGAVLWRDDAGVIATGCNDVPAPRGGLYWTGPGDQRDHVIGHDANERHRLDIASEIADRVAKALELDAEKRAKVLDACQQTRLLDITEFGRAVHAEMDALLSCARTGAETRGSTLYSTTFPCHNCAKHIVAAGVTRVVYIEPYDKSMALDLHDDSIMFDDHGGSEPDENDKRVRFEPFVGIGPRRYFDLFSMKLSNGYRLKRKADGKSIDWTIHENAVARVPMLATSYLDREKQLAQLVTGLLEESDETEDSTR